MPRLLPLFEFEWSGAYCSYASSLKGPMGASSNRIVLLSVRLPGGVAVTKLELYFF